MTRAALLGNPVAHSVAPVLHEYLGQRSGVDMAYEKIMVEPGQLGSTLLALAKQGYAGANITLPYKQDVPKLVPDLDSAAEFTGSVNTVVFGPGPARGFNTDWIGVAGALGRIGLPPLRPSDKVVVLGSGGAARAAIYALHSMGCRTIEVVYLEPADDKTLGLMNEAHKFDIKLSKYATVVRHIEEAKVICNMSSAGMVEQDLAPFDLSLLKHTSLEGKFVLDAVFNPVRTPFLNAAADRGAVTVDGLWMMIYQGLPAFELWTGQHIELSGTQLYELHDLLADEVQRIH